MMAISNSEMANGEKAAKSAPLFSLDIRAIGAFRFFLGLTLVTYWLTRMMEMTEYLTNDGLLPNHYNLFNPPERTWSLLNAFSHRPEVAFIMCIFGVFFICYCLGIGGKTTTFGSLVGAASILSRNLWIENGGHVVMNVLLLWSLFLPTEACWSLKSWLDNGRPAIKEWFIKDYNRSSGVRSIGTIGITYSCILIYLFNYLSKTGVTWQSGTAAHYALWLSPRVSTFAIWARETIPQAALTFASYATLYIEGALPFLIMSPVYRTFCRRIACAAILLLHLSIAAVMNLGAFSYAMICFAIVLYPGKYSLQQKFFIKSPRHVVAALLGLMLITAMTIDSIGRYQYWMRSPNPISIPEWVRVITDYLRIPQNWRMFSYDTPTVGNIILRIGILNNQRFDLDSGKPISLDNAEEMEKYFVQPQPLSILRIESDTRVRALSTDYKKFYQHFLSIRYPRYDSFEIRILERASPPTGMKKYTAPIIQIFFWEFPRVGEKIAKSGHT